MVLGSVDCYCCGQCETLIVQSKNGGCFRQFILQAKKFKEKYSQMASELLVLAIFSFSFQSGLRSNHKIRGDPVSEGVAAFLRRLTLTCSNRETQAASQELSLEKLGNWQPGSKLTKEVLTLISTRLKAANTKGVVTERRPVVPSLPSEKVTIDKEYFLFPI